MLKLRKMSAIDKVILKVAENENYLYEFFRILFMSDIYFLQGPNVDEKVLNGFLMLLDGDKLELHTVSQGHVTFLPLFSEKKEMKKYLRGKKLHYVKMPFPSFYKTIALNFSGCFVLNPVSACMRFTLAEAARYIDRNNISS